MPVLYFHLFFLTSACLALLIYGQVDYHGPAPSANLSTVWESSAPDRAGDGFPNQHAANPLLLRLFDVTAPAGPFLGAGFYCVFPCNSFAFGVYAVSLSPMDQADAHKFYAYTTDSVMVVWSANRKHQVQANATLSFTGDGDLILQDADGSFVWSSGTSGRSVVGMNLTESGNLVLFDHNNVSVWQSFDHPVDSLLPG